VTSAVGQLRLRIGDTVRIRDERWRVAAESSFGAASIIEVDGCDATNHGTRARFLLPFETVDSAAAPPAPPRFVTIDRWRRAARSLLAGAVPRWTSLRTAARANFTVLPFQLEPAIAVASGDACRVLIADEVGLGKTIQAGLIIAETLARTPDARVLIVAPAGLREQWRDELQSRFQLHAEALDAQRLARIAAELVADVNPWSIHPLAITSIDFIKRPEVMRSLETLTWDVLVFDEAHALAGHSDRAGAAGALACRARVVVMLTATPHSGDEEAFSRLSAVGDLADAFPLMTFRRSRADIGFSENRRSSVLKVRPTSDEAAMHRELGQYLQRLSEESSIRGAGTTLLSAILLRRRSAHHKRLMFLATVALATTPLARVIRMVTSAMTPPIGGMLLTNLFLAALIAFDIRKSGRLHPATVGGGLFFVASELFRVAFGHTFIWKSFVHTVVG